MARLVTERLLITGDLVARTALHVGGFGEDVTCDMPLARDGRGRFVVPGTSLAGSFRAWCERAFPQPIVTAIWGSADDDGAASRVCIEDISIGDEGTVCIEIRDGVGIDREWGTAADAIKYDRAVLPRGTRLPLRMTIESDAGSAGAARDVAAALVAALADGEVSLGAAKTRGLGRVRLEDGQIERFDLGSREGTLALLRRLEWEARMPSPSAESQPAASGRVEPAPAAGAPPRLTIEIDWRPVGPLMVKAGADGVAVDTLPLMAGCEGGLSLLLPGSSLKGVLRGQAERVVRTLLDLPLPRSPRPLERFLNQLRNVPLVDSVFGAAGESSRGRTEPPDATPAAADRPLPGLGSLSVDDCHGSARVSREAWGKVLEAAIEPPKGRRASPLREALDEAGLGSWTAAFHVAVDRWTGGAAEQLLFTVMEPQAAAWEPIRLALDFDRLPEHDQLPALMLLLLLVRDLAEGRLPLGYGVNRGLGAVAVDRVRLGGRGLPVDLGPLAGLVLDRGDLAHLPGNLRATIDSAWQTWLATAALETNR
jgi:CRISPR/Cas system CSM-associated protein Csm3 (group 7 of RAMP superfamily)